MSYLPISDDRFAEDLLRRKEIYSLKADPTHDYRVDTIERLASHHLKLRSYQLFARNFMNPDTPYTRLHLSYSTGAGKTIAGCSIAAEFISVYKKIYAIAASEQRTTRKKQHHYAELNYNSPTVFVLGFGGTKAAFIRELMSHPEFGFITIGELDELNRRKNTASSGMTDDVKHYTSYYIYIKKRITNKARGGFYKFYGYDEFVNRLFYSSTTKLVDIDADYKTRYSQSLRNGTEPQSLEEIFAEYLTDGRLQVNEQLLGMFENSLVICDEIHNTYNTDAKNNRGIAIQYLLDHVNTLRFLSLSATIINNSPTEIVETMNYLITPKVTKKEFFSDSRTLREGKLKELGRLTRGYISFLQDINIAYYPERIFDGETLSYNGVEVPYLKFTPCVMSKYHQDTYNWYTIHKNDDIEDINDADVEETETTSLVPTDGYSIYDMVFPNPDEETIPGLFRSSDIRLKLPSVTQEFKDKYLISVKRNQTGMIITGDFLRKENISRYSSKYAKLLQRIDDIILMSNGDPSRVQKIMIYHDRKIMSGAYLIQELLWHNGMLDEFSAPIDSTRCCVCGKILAEHDNTTDITVDITNHQFRPIRFVMAHSDIDKPTMDASLAKYNSADNKNGLNFMILVGSKIIKESYDFKDIRRLLLVSMPVNIPTMIQVLGRAIRTNSHINLPPDQRNVHIEIFVSVSSPDALDPISPEMHRYIDKLADYKTIQLIEREININAIDGDLHRDIIEHGSSKVPTIGNLYYTPNYTIPNYSNDELNTTTFTAYRHMKDEINMITYLIKRLFMVTYAWKYDDLLSAVRRPPVGIEVNPAFFSEDSFVIALHNLINDHSDVTTYTNIIDSLFDYNDKLIYAADVKIPVQSTDLSNYIPHRIRQCGEYFIIFPLEGHRVVVDADVFVRYRSQPTVSRISINAYLNEDRDNINYEANLAKFTEEYSHGYDTDMDFAVMFFDYPDDFQRRFIASAVEQVYTGVEDIPRKRALDLVTKFGAIVLGEETIRYKDVAKHFVDVTKIPRDKPVGYESEKVVRVYDHVANKWFEVNKLALNRHVTYRENNVIVGYYESAGDTVKFKLRKPAHVLMAELSSDTRFLERGMVCTTRGKQSLLEIIAELGISAKTIDSHKVRRLCDVVKRRLFELELKERTKGTNYKWLYLWWTEPVKFK